MCETADTDLLVWNNNRLIQWAKSVDLKGIAYIAYMHNIIGDCLISEFPF